MMWKKCAFTLEAINCMPQYYFLTVNKSSTKLVHLLVSAYIATNTIIYVSAKKKKEKKERKIETM